MKNKRAQGGTTITLIVATIVIVLILMLFFFLSDIVFRVKFEKGSEVSKLVEEHRTEVSLQNFLNSEVKLGHGEQETINMRDLVRLYVIDKTYENELEEKAEKILEPFLNCYFLEIGDLKIGNEKFSKNPMILGLPLSTETTISSSLVIDDKCLEKQNE